MNEFDENTCAIIELVEAKDSAKAAPMAAEQAVEKAVESVLNHICEKAVAAAVQK